jgi:hypothetical protein
MQVGQDVVILTVRCQASKSRFGLRLEQRGGNRWEGTWAFPIREGVAQREGYSNIITGSFEFSDHYPGCPHCKNCSLFLCGCDALSCWDGDKESVRCPSCSKEITLRGTVTSLSVGEDA